MYEVHWLAAGTRKTICGIDTIKCVFTFLEDVVTCKHCVANINAYVETLRLP